MEARELIAQLQPDVRARKRTSHLTSRTDRFFEVSDEHGTADLLLVDAGHYETEAGTEQLLVDRLRLSLPDIEFSRTTVRTSPVRTFTRS